MDHTEIERWHRLKNLKKASQFLVVAALLFLVSVYLISYYLGREPDEFQSHSPSESGIRIENFSYSSPGAHPWELQASGAQVSDSLERVVLERLKMIYRGAKGGDVVLTAKSGKLDRKSRNVSAEGDVVIRRKDLLLKTGEIHYSQKDLLVETPARVTAEGPDLLLTGKGLKLSLERREVVIEQDVNAVLFNVKWVEPGRKLPM